MVVLRISVPRGRSLAHSTSLRALSRGCVPLKGATLLRQGYGGQASLRLEKGPGLTTTVVRNTADTTTVKKGLQTKENRDSTAIEPRYPMKTAVENKIGMFLSVIAVCDDKQTVLAALPAFAKAYQDFKTHVANIQVLARKQVRRKTGVAEDKQRLREDMCSQAAPVAAAVKVYAEDNKNRELAQRVNYSHSVLLVGRDIISADRCRDILAAATENLAKLGDYGVTSAKLTAIQAAIDAYAAAITKPREAHVLAKTVTGSIAEEAKAADAILKGHLDKLVSQLEDKDATFVADYRNARVIVAAAATRASGDQPPAPAQAATTTTAATTATK